MSHVTIPDQDAFVEYAAQTGTGPFTVPFAIFEKADLVVLVDGVDIGQAGFSYAATSSTTGGYQTGEITLAVAAAADDVLIYRQISPTRTIDLGPGPQTRDALNSAFDRIYAKLQDHEQDLARCIRVGITETQGRLGEPPASGYVLLARNSDGEVYETDGSLDSLAPHTSWTSYLEGNISTTLFGATSIVWTRLNAGDATHYLSKSGSDPIHVFDTNDYISYDRASNFYSIVIAGGTRLTLGTTSTSISNNFLPITTESQDLGSLTKEWNNLYVQNAVTVSDERLKDDLGRIDGAEALAFMQALEPKWFRYKDTVIPAREDVLAREITTPDGTKSYVREVVQIPEQTVSHKRPHAGFMAQQVKQAMKKVRWIDFAGYAYDAEQDIHSLRLLEFIGVMTSAIQHLAQQAAPIARSASQRTVTVRGQQVRVGESDALALFGALAICLDGETAHVVLASGDTLDLTHEDIPVLGRQLAGTPADEVSG